MLYRMCTAGEGIVQQMGQLRQRAALCRMQLERVKSLVNNPEGQELEPLVPTVPRVPTEGTSPSEASASVPATVLLAEESEEFGHETREDRSGSLQVSVGTGDDRTPVGAPSALAPMSVPSAGEAAMRHHDLDSDKFRAVTEETVPSSTEVPGGSQVAVSPEGCCHCDGGSTPSDTARGAGEVAECLEGSSGDTREGLASGEIPQAVGAGTASPEGLPGEPMA